MFLNAIRRDRIIQHSPLRENSGSMQFVETKEVSSCLPQEMKFVRCILRLEDFKKSFYMVFAGVPTKFSWPVSSPR